MSPKAESARPRNRLIFPIIGRVLPESHANDLASLSGVGGLNQLVKFPDLETSVINKDHIRRNALNLLESPSSRNNVDLDLFKAWLIYAHADQMLGEDTPETYETKILASAAIMGNIARMADKAVGFQAETGKGLSSETLEILKNAYGQSVSVIKSAIYTYGPEANLVPKIDGDVDLARARRSGLVLDVVDFCVETSGIINDDKLLSDANKRSLAWLAIAEDLGALFESTMDPGHDMPEEDLPKTNLGRAIRTNVARLYLGPLADATIKFSTNGDLGDVEKRWAEEGYLRKWGMTYSDLIEFNLKSMTEILAQNPDVLKIEVKPSVLSTKQTSEVKA